MRTLAILFLLISIGCQDRTDEQYTAGIPLFPNSVYLSTKQSFDSFSLHTWMHDTLYRHCGQELQIEPNDSTLQYEAFVKGAKLYYTNIDYKFVLEPTDSIVNLTLVINGKDTINKKFVSPNLPLPVLARESSGDSIVLSLHQKDKRIQEILPMDCRYGFNTENGRKRTIVVAKEDADLEKLDALRLNYMDKFYPVQISNE